MDNRANCAFSQVPLSSFDSPLLFSIPVCYYMTPTQYEVLLLLPTVMSLHLQKYKWLLIANVAAVRNNHVVCYVPLAAE